MFWIPLFTYRPVRRAAARVDASISDFAGCFGDKFLQQ